MIILIIYCKSKLLKKERVLYIYNIIALLLMNDSYWFSISSIFPGSLLVSQDVPCFNSLKQCGSLDWVSIVPLSLFYWLGPLVKHVYSGSSQFPWQPLILINRKQIIYNGPSKTKSNRIIWFQEGYAGFAQFLLVFSTCVLIIFVKSLKSWLRNVILVP